MKLFKFFDSLLLIDYETNLEKLEQEFTELIGDLNISEFLNDLNCLGVIDFELQWGEFSFYTNDFYFFYLWVIFF